MIETLIAEERKAWIESLDGVDQPTCDLEDGLPKRFWLKSSTTTSQERSYPPKE